MKEKLLDAFLSLIKVKSIITLALVATLIYLTVNQRVDNTMVISLVSSVVTYYFARNSNGNSNNSIDNNQIVMPELDSVDDEPLPAPKFYPLEKDDTES